MSESQTLSDSITTELGEAWNGFWFSPEPESRATVARITAGLVSMAYWLTWLGDASLMFSSNGFFSPEIVRTTARELGRNPSLNPIMLIDTAFGLTAFVAAGVLVSGLLALGIKTKITAPLAFLGLSLWMNRAPELTSAAEWLLGSLLFAQLGLLAQPDCHSSRHWSTGFSLRLAQVAATFFFVAVAVAVIAQPSWRNGTAIWELAARTISRAANFESLRDSPLFVNAWTHFVAFSLSLLPLGLWLPRLRVIATAAAVTAYSSLIPLTGDWFTPLVISAACMPFFSLNFPARKAAEKTH